MAQRHRTPESIFSLLPKNFQMLGLEYWLSICGESKGALLMEADTRVALTFPTDSFFTQSTLLFEPVIVPSERSASLR